VADDRRAAESAALALVEERCRQEALLAAEANVQRRHEEVFAAKADVQRRHEEVMYNIAMRKCWRRRLKYNVATRKCWRRRPTYNVATRKCWRQRQPMYKVGTSRPHGLWSPTRRLSAFGPLDAIMAEIACEEAAFKTKLSPRHPTSYVDAILSNMGGGTQPFLPHAVSPSALVPAALPSPDVDSQRQMVRPRARPRRHTG
jgi:hypothetical protein